MNIFILHIVGIPTLGDDVGVSLPALGTQVQLHIATGAHSKAEHTYLNAQQTFADKLVVTVSIPPVLLKR